MQSSSITAIFTRPGNKHWVCTMYVGAWTSMGVTDLYQRLTVCSPCPQCDVNSVSTKGQSISSCQESHEEDIRRLTQSRNLNLTPDNCLKHQDESVLSLLLEIPYKLKKEDFYWPCILVEGSFPFNERFPFQVVSISLLNGLQGQNDMS